MSGTPPRFSIFSSGRGAGKFAAWNIQSVRRQDFGGGIQHLIVDDASPDDTWTQIDRAVDGDPRCWPFRMPDRQRKLANFLHFLPAMTGEILVELDLDDWFGRDDALAVIAAAYDADPQVEATAGSHHGWPSGATIYPSFQPARGFRLMQNGFALSTPAPRTWLRRLTERSLREARDLYLDPKTGAPWETNADLAMFAPALLWAPRIASIEEVLVEVSVGGGAHDHAEDLAKQREEGLRLFEQLLATEWRANEHLLRPFQRQRAGEA